ncbi:MAG: hypothetical protein E6Q97_18675 [Desulfurellales bacterium]|nr:MAG: hypothetical protein E6Q97_18675 [Desulfurellales bacterium]
MSTLVAPKPYGSSIPWTDERIQQLKRLHQVGIMPSEIGRLVGGFSRERVLGKLYELGLIAQEPPRYERDTPATVPKNKPESRPISVFRASGPKIKRRKVAPVTSRSFAQSDNLAIHGIRACAFPLGDPGTPGFRYCGHALAEGGQSAYCVHHHGVVYKGAPSDDFEGLLSDLEGV